MESHQESSCMLPRNGRRVILLPMPFEGHINPMLQLGSLLYRKGFSITIIHTEFNFPKSSGNYPHFDFHEIHDGLSESEASDDDGIAILLALNTKCIVPLMDCLSKLMMNTLSNKSDDDDSVACLIADSLWDFVPAVANEFKLPIMVFQSFGAAAFLAMAAYPLLHEKGYLPFQQDSQPEERVKELPPLRVKDIPDLKTRYPEQGFQWISAMVAQIKASSGIIWNSFQELEQEAFNTFRNQYSTVTLFPIGPLHKHFQSSASSNSIMLADRSSISWLDKQAPKSVIYASFGSVCFISETQFLEVAWGLANSKVPFLLAVRPGLVLGMEWVEQLPKGLLEMVDGRGYVVKWAPQQQVLTHPAVGGFLTHCGWNSTLESLCERVPMICQPCYGDQFVNARYVSHVWRVGLHLEGKWDRIEIERAIRRLMVEAEGQEMRNRMVGLREKVDICLKQGGSSHQSLEGLVARLLSF